MNSFIPWVGGKGKLLWIINKLMPDRYTRFIDVFGGSGTVTMCRPIQRGCISRCSIRTVEAKSSRNTSIRRNTRLPSSDECSTPPAWCWTTPALWSRDT